jgi:hypothetical protein
MFVSDINLYHFYGDVKGFLHLFTKNVGCETLHIAIKTKKDMGTVLEFVKGYFFYQFLKIGSENGILVFDKNFSYLRIKFRFSKGFNPHLIKRLIRDNICQSLLHYS